MTDPNYPFSVNRSILTSEQQKALDVDLSNAGDTSKWAKNRENERIKKLNKDNYIDTLNYAKIVNVTNEHDTYTNPDKFTPNLNKAIDAYVAKCAKEHNNMFLSDKSMFDAIDKYAVSVYNDIINRIINYLYSDVKETQSTLIQKISIRKTHIVNTTRSYECFDKLITALHLLLRKLYTQTNEAIRNETGRPSTPQDKALYHIPNMLKQLYEIGAIHRYFVQHKELEQLGTHSLSLHMYLKLYDAVHKVLDPITSN